jgi:hypothetical protein
LDILPQSRSFFGGGVCRFDGIYCKLAM